MNPTHSRWLISVVVGGAMAAAACSDDEGYSDEGYLGAGGAYGSGGFSAGSGGFTVGTGGFAAGTGGFTVGAGGFAASGGAIGAGGDATSGGAGGEPPGDGGPGDASADGGASGDGGPDSGDASSDGGASSNGGASSAGGASSNGGASSAGGASSNGGAASTGGASSNGGAASTGGASSDGGASSTGGASSDGGAASTGGASSDGGASSTGGASSDGGASSTGGASSDGGAASTGGASAAGGASSAGGSGAGGGTSTSCSPPTLPSVIGTCPTFREGEVTFTVGGTPRTVRLWMDPTASAAQDGPLVIYWYATFGAPTQASTALGAAGISRIKAAGGIVAAPVHVNGGTFPWLTGGTTDFALMDQIVACAEAQTDIDDCHIHSLGMSAGGLQTARVSYARSSYIASVATYSGGGTGTPQDPSNRFAAMILHGGNSDSVFGVDFQAQSIAYRNDLPGHFTIMCNHGGGHTLPFAAAPSVVQFFFDHPYKVSPSPYASGLPGSFPDYCTL